MLSARLAGRGVGDTRRHEIPPEARTPSHSRHLNRGNYGQEQGRWLGEGLLVWQVLWFCINCGTRLAQRLPLSLLEVSTIAHGASTLLTYCFWWKKPFNVREPILINCKTEEEASIGASMSVFSGAGHNVLCGLMCLREESEGTSLACISVNSLVLEAMDEGEDS